MISRLIYRSLLGTITPGEQRRLDQWLGADASHRELYRSLTDPSALQAERQVRRLIDTERPARDMQRRIDALRRRRIAAGLVRAAAAVAVVGAIGWGAWRLVPGLGETEAPLAVTTAAPAAPAFVPGHTRAVVSDAMGHRASLDAGEGVKGAAQPTAPLNAATGSLFTVPTLEARQLNLEVPRGGEYHIVLEDSTEVWLNAQSSISYPELFGPRERRVSVTGEVYFKVRKDAARPFYVETAGQVIRVYGTTFNVRSYSDEAATYTTLETGRISLRRDAASGEIFLRQGHQAVLDHGSETVTLGVVDPETVTSWRHGRFVFENQPLGRIMADLSRWYNFSYEFADPSLARRVFMGGIERYADFATAIQVLENCGGLHFDIPAVPGGTVVISAAE